jgi:hypothetical protein
MNKQHAMFLAALAAFAVLPTATRADDGAYNASADATVYRPQTCAEAKANAWLNRQMELTDGDVSPKVPTPFECETERAKVLAATDEAY